MTIARLAFLLLVVFGLTPSMVAYGDDAESKDDGTKPPEAGVKQDQDSPASLPKYQDMLLPSAEELLKAKPFDWIVLKANEVLVTEPVSPRPDTLARLAADYERYYKARAGFPEGDEFLKEKRRQFQKLQVTLRETNNDVDPDYVIDLKAIQRIECFEDLLLQRANQCIDEGQIPIAYDLLMLVERRNRDNNLRIVEVYEARKKEEIAAKLLGNDRNRVTISELPAPKFVRAWPKFEEIYHKLLFRDAEMQTTRGNNEGAMRLLENLWDHNASYPGLSDQLGSVVDRLITANVEKNDFRQARYFIHRLANRDAQHSIVVKWKEDLLARTNARIEEARTASTQGNARLAANLVEQAARIWPETPGLKEIHRELVDRYQVVRLGFTRLPGEPTMYPMEPREEAEIKAMVLQPLFEPTRVDERSVRYRSAFFDSWEPTDLGRKVQFNLRIKRADWESRAIITSADLFEEFNAKLDPHRSTYDERLAGAIEEISVQSPSQLTIQFRQLPLRLEALLRFSVPLSEGSRDLNSDIVPEAAAVAGRQRLFESARDEKQVGYRRVRPQPAMTKTRYIDEIVAVRYDNWDRALQGLFRGEISGIPHGALRDLKSLQDDNRFLVIPYAQPVSHFVLFNPRSMAMRDGQLRRALSLAMPRDELMNQYILGGLKEPMARVSVTPFPSNGYGHNRLLAEPAYDPQRAAALALTAKKRFGDQLPDLKLALPPDPAIRELAMAMVENWRRVGITVVVVDDRSATSASDWDMVYVATSIAEPFTDLWPTLSLDPGCTVESLKLFPERVRHQLLELERANDWNSAKNQLRRIEAELLVEARYIPLWEVDDFFVTRRQLVGLPARPMTAFHGVERWTLQPWYPTETP